MVSQDLQLWLSNAPPNGNQLTSPVVGWYSTGPKDHCKSSDLLCFNRTWYDVPRDAVVAFEDVVRVNGLDEKGEILLHLNGLSENGTMVLRAYEDPQSQLNSKESVFFPSGPDILEISYEIARATGEHPLPYGVVTEAKCDTKVLVTNIKSGGGSAAVLCAAKVLGQFKPVGVDITTL
ncbi:hypothetical protein Tco_0549600 [Tanacetum coccineum]